MAGIKIGVQELPDGIVVLNLEGSLYAYTYEQLQGVINELFNNKFYRLIVDMSGVDYISSAGAGIFIGAIAIAQENRGNIVILGLTSSVKEVFDLFGLTQIVPVSNNMESAIRILEA